MSQEKTLVRSKKDDRRLLAIPNVVTSSGRVYGDTRMDTSWAFRQAYASCSVSSIDC